MKRKAIILFICAAALLSVFTGCASLDLRESENDETSIVFGYLDMEEAPSGLNYVTIKQLRPVVEKPFLPCKVDHGLFYRENMVPGSYQFVEFGGQQMFLIFSNGQYSYQFPTQGKKDMDPVIDVPGIYYVGSYKYKNVKTGWFEAGKFEIEQTADPTEAELLELLLERSTGTRWEQRIKARLEALK